MSAVERKPAQLVAQPLVVEDKFSDPAGELGALPPAFQAAGRLECQWQRARLPSEIRDLVLDDQRLRNELCWFVFDC